mgnify:CR=1 FL=1
MACGVLLFAWKDALVKLTGGYYSPILIMWIQFVFMSAIWLPILVYQNGWNWLIPKPLVWQSARGLSLVIGMGLFYWSVLLIPLTDATAMALISPLIVTALSTLMLDEKVGIHRWGAVIIGFMGALILLRPAFAGESLGYAIAFGSGICIGFFYATNRKLGRGSLPLASVVYPAYLSAIVLCPLIPFKWTPPRPEDTYIIVGFLILTAAGQTMIISAFRYGQASLVAPFNYIQIVGAALFGYFIFSELPDPTTWTGVGVIILSGLYIAIRDHRISYSK